MPEVAPFTLFGVLRDALGSIASTWLAHALFAIVFVALLFGSCCGVFCLMVPLAMLLGVVDPTEGATDDPPMAMMVAIYVVLALVDVGLFAFHEGVTLELTHAHARAQPARLGAALSATFRRGPALVGVVLLRAIADAVPPTLLVCVGAAFLAALGAPETEPARVAAAVATTLAYFVTVAWLLFTRAQFGLAVSCAVRDGLGPRDALERSRRLLHGRRLHFLAFRVGFFVLGIGLYCLAFTPFVVVAAIDPTAVDRPSDDGQALLGLAVIAVVYGIALALFALDSILVGSYHARLARPADVSAIAKVFE